MAEMFVAASERPVLEIDLLRLVFPIYGAEISR